MSEVTIDASNDTGSDITPFGAVNITYCDNQTFTYLADNGYEINQVLVDGSNVQLQELTPS